MGMTGSLIYTKAKENLRFQRARITLSQGLFLCDAQVLEKLNI